MRHFSFKHFYPLPQRGYDINRYQSYIHSVMGVERKQEPSWHCFAVFDDKIKQQIIELIEEHDDCECYCKAIYEDDLVDDELTKTEAINRKEVQNVAQ